MEEVGHSALVMALEALWLMGPLNMMMVVAEAGEYADEARDAAGAQAEWSLKEQAMGYWTLCGPCSVVYDGSYGDRAGEGEVVEIGVEVQLDGHEIAAGRDSL